MTLLKTELGRAFSAWGRLTAFGLNWLLAQTRKRVVSRGTRIDCPLLHFRPLVHNGTYTMTDRQTAYSISIFGSQAGDERQDGTTPSRVQQQLVDFIMDFHLDNVFLYRDQIRENVLVKQYYCDIDIAHLISYDEELAHKLQQDPADIIPLVSLSSLSAIILLTLSSLKQHSRRAHNELYTHRKGTSSFPSINCCSTLPPRSSPSATSRRTTYRISSAYPVSSLVLPHFPRNPQR